MATHRADHPTREINKSLAEKVHHERVYGLPPGFTEWYSNQMYAKLGTGYRQAMMEEAGDIGLLAQL